MRPRHIWLGLMLVLGWVVSSAALSTSLHHAVKQGDSDQVKRLLAQGADINAPDVEGYTPLHWASFAGYVEVAAVLLAQGADVSAKSHKGRTALHVAAALGHTDIVARLVAHNARANVKDENDSTPLHSAARGGYVSAVYVLLGHGADVTARDKDNKTPVDSAVMGEHALIATLLRQHATMYTPRLQWEYTRVYYQYPAGQSFTIHLPKFVHTPSAFPPTITLDASVHRPGWLQFDPEKRQLSGMAPPTATDRSFHLIFLAEAARDAQEARNTQEAWDEGRSEHLLHLYLTIVPPMTPPAITVEKKPDAVTPSWSSDEMCLVQLLKGEPCVSVPVAPTVSDAESTTSTDRDEACLVQLLKGQPCGRTS